MSQKIHFFCKTQPNIDRTHFLWTLDRFSSLTLQDEKVASLRTADDSDTLLEMKLFFVELDEEEKIQIEVTNPHCVEYCKCRVSVLDINGISVESFQDESVFSSEDAIDKRQVPPFLSKRKLVELRNQSLPNDTLSLKCEFSCYRGMKTYISENTFCNLDDFNSAEPQLSSASTIDTNQKSTVSPLGEDLKILFDNQILCDVKLRTTTDTFHAHKIILSARSPVFRAMFTSDMKENVQQCVEIPDVDADTMREMLRYIYTDTVTDLQWKNAYKLYEVADKYGILNLKENCSSVLRSYLLATNACEVLILSYLHEDVELKKAVQNYILNHEKEIIISENWKDLMKNHSFFSC
ncbi:hypothetical protein CDAR_11861 [Caerostris darwini]|uniref:BTB domain-containing protein n=1 Tax=Caerostris darwini TaxID=1538125 RepID=A0AAV4RA62_9ARAC|nr:hypothetical protein CDAR_11861 [Caerostris darwini]